MARTIAIGVQNFETLLRDGCFYIDKTEFIKEWWESRDQVTLITRPRRFGKTLNMSMVECFFSIKYQRQGEVFSNLNIWKEENYRNMQGTYPVLFLSFAGVKDQNCSDAIENIKANLVAIYNQNRFLVDENFLNPAEKEQFESVTMNMSDVTAAKSLQFLCGYLNKYYHKKVIILMDEYDTPLQEAYVNGYWKELVSFIRNLFNNTFKTNSFLERAIMTGVTRVSKESMFSDLNNLNVVTVTSKEYAACFGFTEVEVFSAMDEYGLTNKEEVKHWYDGFSFGDLKDIYNPWSIINFLDKKELKPYWANTSSNSLAGSLIQTGNRNIKMKFEDLLQQRTISSVIDDEMIFNQLDDSDENAVWSLLFASGYLKAVTVHGETYELKLTNYEVRKMFETMVRGWFGKNSADYNDFIKALLRADVEEMNSYMERVAESMFSSFDGGKTPSAKTTPERFYHGFVLGLLVDLRGRYEVLSNRESGFGRYDVMLSPLHKTDDAIILEFKVFNPKKEKTLEETAQNALQQIADKQYEQTLLDQGIDKASIRKYGFAFCGKEVLIKDA